MYFWFQVAGTGNTKEFEHLICNDPAQLTVFNPTGMCAAHNAAARNRVAILTLIVQYNGGRTILTNIVASLLFLLLHRC